MQILLQSSTGELVASVLQPAGSDEVGFQAETSGALV